MRGPRQSRWLRIPAFALLAALLAVACGCAPVPGGQSILLAMDGPPLALAGEAGNERFAGEMTRECMVGSGQFSIVSLERDLACAGSIEGGPGPKGRVRGIIGCDDGSRFMFTMRNLGADQGIGIGRFVPGADQEPAPLPDAPVQASQPLAQTGAQPDYLDMPPLIFFYHPWDEEAWRRLGPLKEDIQKAMEEKARTGE